MIYIIPQISGMNMEDHIVEMDIQAFMKEEEYKIVYLSHGNYVKLQKSNINRRISPNNEMIIATPTGSKVVKLTKLLDDNTIVACNAHEDLERLLNLKAFW